MVFFKWAFFGPNMAWKIFTLRTRRFFGELERRSPAGYPAEQTTTRMLSGCLPFGSWLWFEKCVQSLRCSRDILRNKTSKIKLLVRLLLIVHLCILGTFLGSNGQLNIQRPFIKSARGFTHKFLFFLTFPNKHFLKKYSKWADYYFLGKIPQFSFFLHFLKL